MTTSFLDACHGWEDSHTHAKTEGGKYTSGLGRTGIKGTGFAGVLTFGWRPCVVVLVLVLGAGWRQRQMRAWRARSVAGVGRKQQGRRYQQPRDRLRKM